LNASLLSVFCGPSRLRLHNVNTRKEEVFIHKREDFENLRLHLNQIHLRRRKMNDNNASKIQNMCESTYKNFIA